MMAIDAVNSIGIPPGRDAFSVGRDEIMGMFTKSYNDYIWHGP